MSLTHRVAHAVALVAIAALGGTAEAQSTTSSNDTEALEAQLLREVSPETLVELARLRNPDVAEARLRADAAAARARAAGQLPMPEIQGEIREQPLDRPFGFDEANGMLMLGIRQTLPPGLGARRDAARAARSSANEAARGRALDISRDVTAAFWEYARAHETLAAREETIAIGEQLARLSRVSYENGRASQQDMVRIGLDVSRARSDLAGDEAMLAVARARLNALLARDPDAPLGPPAAIDARAAALPAVDVLADRLAKERPEVLAAERELQRARAEATAARRDARIPSLMLGFDYGYMPMEGMDVYSAMVGVTIPWLWGGRRDEARAAERAADAEARALESVRNAAAFELRDAYNRVEGARRSLELLDDQIVPQARQNLDAAQAAFVGGRGDALSMLDALRSLTAVRIERAAAVARLEIALADLARAAGVEPTTLSDLSKNGADR